MKQQPEARRLTADEAAVLTRRGEHCDARRCRQPVAIVTWRWITRRGQQRVYERIVCEAHGQKFARRHNLAVIP